MNIDDYLPSTLDLQKIFLDRVHVDIISIVESNIFEEHHFLVRKQQHLEQLQDWYGVIHCSNLISMLPKLVNVQLYKIHLTWFQDRYMLYARAKKDVIENILGTNTRNDKDNFQVFHEKFDILGIIEDQ